MERIIYKRKPGPKSKTGLAITEDYERLKFFSEPKITYEEMVEDCKANKCFVALYSCNVYRRLEPFVKDKYQISKREDINSKIGKLAWRFHKRYYFTRLPEIEQTRRYNAICRKIRIHHQLYGSNSCSSSSNIMDSSESESEEFTEKVYASASSSENEEELLFTAVPIPEESQQPNSISIGTYSQFAEINQDNNNQATYKTSTQTIVKEPPNSEDIFGDCAQVQPNTDYSSISTNNWIDSENSSLDSYCSNNTVVEATISQPTYSQFDKNLNENNPTQLTSSQCNRIPVNQYSADTENIIPKILVRNRLSPNKVKAKDLLSQIKDM